VFIEVIRGVPLITVLIMANTMLPLFLPAGVSVDRLLRPLIGVAIFASAYMAEVVRGGLQAVPKGQYEGAMSLGLGYWQMMRLIILPQAFRKMTPLLLQQSIILFQDTSLVYTVGLVDFLNSARSSGDIIGRSNEFLIVAGLVYFTISFAASRLVKFMQKRLAV
jgi:glutamate/aspartate transport system permease protein